MIINNKGQRSSKEDEFHNLIYIWLIWFSQIDWYLINLIFTNKLILQMVRHGRVRIQSRENWLSLNQKIFFWASKSNSMKPICCICPSHMGYENLHLRSLGFIHHFNRLYNNKICTIKFTVNMIVESITIVVAGWNKWKYKAGAFLGYTKCF